MSMDLAGRRATRIAGVAVHIAIAIAIVGAGFILMPAVSTVIWNRRVPASELMILLPLGVVIAGLLLLRAFLRDVLAGHVFTVINARRLARIGWLMIGYAVAKFLPAIAGLVMGGSGVASLMFVLLQPVVVNGLLVLVIASVWRYGTELQAERDLTV